MKILTGNDLKSGAVVWWTGNGWSPNLDEAVDVGERGEEIAAREEAARRVVSAYAIEAERTDQGLRPRHIKERIRALGPTVRPDLLRPSSRQDIMNWVI